MCRDLRYPFKGKLYYVHHRHSFPVGNKTLHTFKGGYIVGSLKFSGTLFQGRGVTIYRVRIKSVSFKIYGYSPISPIGRIKTTVDYLQIRESKPKVSDLALNLIRQNG